MSGLIQPATSKSNRTSFGDYYLHGLRSYPCEFCQNRVHRKGSSSKTTANRMKLQGRTIKPYRHGPLSNFNGICLLKLKAEPVSGMFSFAIEQFSHISTVVPGVLAICYCWGDPTSTKDIFLNEYYYKVLEKLYEGCAWLRRKPPRSALQRTRRRTLRSCLKHCKHFHTFNGLMNNSITSLEKSGSGAEEQFGRYAEDAAYNSCLLRVRQVHNSLEGNTGESAIGCPFSNTWVK